ncbi:TetR/AcrR family transcriptional regulator [Catellatospora chokoriensis]|uniref:TetR family transcriptional regulator n=2 Tax=Catellatospora chokoriensis TaxID=310353 RepID=A0A8J3KBA4_9ACTN|nr:TetR family transcriptional regulator [Catellatospora chokoriensis]
MSMEFLWGARAQPTRGPKPSLTLLQITDAAITIADAEGLAAVSMQRVSAELGFTKMSLYRYLPGKGELVALMVERAIGAPPPPNPGDWRAALREWAHGLLTAYLRHPWALEATVGPRPLGPHELGWMECALTALADTGLSGAERLDAIAVLAGHVRMIAQQAAAMRDPDAQFSAGVVAVLAEHGDRFPLLAETMAAVAAEGGQDQAFEFGLDRILDGLQTLITSRRRANR